MGFFNDYLTIKKPFISHRNIFKPLGLCYIIIQEYPTIYEKNQKEEYKDKDR